MPQLNIFCQLVQQLQLRTFEMNNIVELIQAVQNVVAILGGFNSTFDKLGY